MWTNTLSAEVDPMADVVSKAKLSMISICLEKLSRYPRLKQHVL
jgi:hypothetical protein